MAFGPSDVRGYAYAAILAPPFAMIGIVGLRDLFRQVESINRCDVEPSGLKLVIDSVHSSFSLHPWPCAFASTTHTQREAMAYAYRDDHRMRPVLVPRNGGRSPV